MNVPQIALVLDALRQLKNNARKRPTALRQRLQRDAAMRDDEIAQIEAILKSGAMGQSTDA